MPTNTEIARSFFDAAERSDADAFRSLCAPDVRVSQNGGAPMNLDAFLAFVVAIGKAVTDPHYENIVTRDTSDGFVEEHDFCATLADNSKVRIPACVVATIAGGRITSLREYLDSAAGARLFAALQTRS